MAKPVEVIADLLHHVEDEGHTDETALAMAYKVLDSLLRHGYVVVPALDVQRAVRWICEEDRHWTVSRERLREAVRCRCETVHDHCYAAYCPCPLHAEEVAGG